MHNRNSNYHSSGLDAITRAKVLQGYSYFLKEQDISWHLTASFNRETTTSQGYKLLKEWHSRLDREIYGRNYYKRNNRERTFFVAFPEVGGFGRNLHYHLLARMPLWAEEKFVRIAERKWSQIVKTGDLCVQKIANTDSDLSRAISYDLKDIWKIGDTEDIIISTQFSTFH